MGSLRSRERAAQIECDVAMARPVAIAAQLNSVPPATYARCEWFTS
jgi:hypothetical protein